MLKIDNHWNILKPPIRWTIFILILSRSFHSRILSQDRCPSAINARTTALRGHSPQRAEIRSRPWPRASWTFGCKCSRSVVFMPKKIVAYKWIVAYTIEHYSDMAYQYRFGDFVSNEDRFRIQKSLNPMASVIQWPLHCQSARYTAKNGPNSLLVNVDIPITKRLRYPCKMIEPCPWAPYLFRWGSLTRHTLHRPYFAPRRVCDSQVAQYSWIMIPIRPSFLQIRVLVNISILYGEVTMCHGYNML